MEISQFPELCFNSSPQWPLNSFDDELNMMELAVAFGGDDHHLNHDAPMFNHYYYNKPPPPPPPPHVMEPLASRPRPAKQLKTSSSSSWNSCITTSHHHHHESMMNILPNPKEELGTVSSKTINCDTQFGKSPATTPQAYHILAERNRREKLSQRFIALSALIPGLKKMDKASVLGDAIKHLKNLQEKLKALEEQAKKKSSTESVVFVKRYEVLADHGGEISSSDENFSFHDDQLPQVEARFSGKDVLIRVHCEKKAGVVQETLALIQKFHLSVINTTAITFASYALDITVVAQMDQDFTMTMKDLVKNLRTSLK